MQLKIDVCGMGGRESFAFLLYVNSNVYKEMISKEQVLEAATTACEIVNKNTENNLSIAKISVNKANNIVIYLQKLTNVTIDDCANVSKEIEKLLDRDVEDFSLTVSSMGSK